MTLDIYGNWRDPKCVDGQIQVPIRKKDLHSAAHFVLDDLVKSRNKLWLFFTFYSVLDYSQSILKCNLAAVDSLNLFISS